ncbi:MAG: TIGR00341 family protein, partial [Granulosicoccaceae bacterium]
MKVIEVIADAGHEDTIRGIAEQHGAEDCWIGAEDADGRRAMRLLVAPGNRQAVLDALQSTLGTSENWHLLIVPTEAVLPKPEMEKEKEKDKGNGDKKTRTTGLSREELYNIAERNARLDRNYLALVCLSTIVVAIGLIADNIAVVIGAMVIAPLLGPNIALALGTALGDTPLMWQSLRTSLAGLGLALGLCIAIGYFSPFDIGSVELMSRTRVGPEAILLALASGAAAVISLTSGFSTVLVGVMVAV